MVENGPVVEEDREMRDSLFRWEGMSQSDGKPCGTNVIRQQWDGTWYKRRFMAGTGHYRKIAESLDAAALWWLWIMLSVTHNPPDNKHRCHRFLYSPIHQGTISNPGWVYGVEGQWVITVPVYQWRLLSGGQLIIMARMEWHQLN